MELFIFVIVVLTIYFVVKSAIDNSEMATNIEEIRNILASQNLNEKIIEENTPQPLKNISIDKCPGCGCKVSESDKNCPVCELALI